MHGPFLFHVAALSYLLFGDSDAASRYCAAIFGAATVLLPWFLRRETGALGGADGVGVAPDLALVPLFRALHPPRCLLGVLHASLLHRGRPLRRPAAPGLAVRRAAAWGFLFTNKEDVFIVTAIFGSALAVALLWPAARRVFLLGAGFVVALGVVVKVLPKLLGWPALPAIPWDNPSNEAIRDLRHRAASRTRSSSPRAPPRRASASSRCRHSARRRAARAGPRDFSARFPAGTPMAAARTLLRDRRILAIAIGVAAGIYIVLYTSLFSNIAASSPARSGRSSTGLASTTCAAPSSPGSTTCCCCPSMTRWRPSSGASASC